ncbi:MAG: DUF5103 domain-containing protein [Muribaculaceae bacterium]|nr:DUF5103 domain-containing protein [Muribaculaceae bacterium]
MSKTLSISTEKQPGSIIRVRMTALLLSALTTLTSLATADTSTAIFDPLFRTLTVTLDGDMMLDPVLDLKGNHTLTISFDEITDDPSFLLGRLLQCNSDWQPSQLHENENVTGFNYIDIEDYAFSNNTFIHYVNYKVTIPNEEMEPLASGNYLLQVFERDEPDEVLLQARFRVSENSVTISGNASARTDKGLNDIWQQLNLSVDPGNMMIQNPYTDIIVEVEQNHRPDTRRVIEHPMRVQGSQIIYEHEPRLIFPASNEYRRFETVRTNYPGMHIDSTSYEGNMYHAWLNTDTSRADRNYLYDRTQRGRYKIDEYNSTDPDLGADYVMTHFTFDFPEVYEGDVYVDGDLFLNSYSDLNRMKYDREQGVYTLDVPLKQGSYNYQYVLRPHNGDRQTDTSLTEGNKFETVNEYNIAVWLRQPGMRAERLLGTATFITN